MTSLVLTLALAVVIGVSLGLLGGGGSILAVPLLIYVTGLPVDEAIATSLFVVGVTSAVVLVPYAWARRVRWRTGLLLGLAGMAGAYGGGRLAAVVPGTVLVIMFALMMLATAVGMIRGRRAGAAEPGDAGRGLAPARAVAVGAMVGVVAGLVGAGGGFLVVPALTLLGGLPMAVAVGTSLAVIAMQSLAGFAGHLAAVAVDWTLTAALTGAAVAGSLVGSRLSRRVPERRLRPAFGWFVLAVGTLVLGQQVTALAA
ncbi:sulfite exporter TauE/SafE family protein [Micromonospora sp. NPDC005298]|uniref:sulfite exporter TauE/SafE family protein n=1 Tax=Micromonospora sp. NPDC005298 TaxID=3156873 RepID=UPI0033BE62EF